MYPVIPETTPALVTSQEVVSIATVDESFPSVVVLVELRVVKAPVPGVVAPMDTKFAAPAPDTSQLASVMATLAEALPRVRLPE